LKIDISNLPNGTYTFQWLKDDQAMPGKNQSTLFVKQPGVYKVEITINGQTEAIGSLNLTVNPKPLADFSFTPASGCGKTTVSFTNNSHNGVAGQINNLEYSWNFDNGKTSNKRIPDPVRFSPPAGTGSYTYNIRLITKNTQTNCSDTLIKPLTLSRGSEASLTSDAEIKQFNGEPYFTVCNSIQANLTFYNISTITNSQYVIDWGDNTPVYSSSVFTTLTHQYNVGTFKLVLIAKGGACNDTSIYNIFVGSNPRISVGNPGNTTILCTGDSLTFPISETDNNPPGTLYRFKVNDGTDTIVLSHPAPKSITIPFNKSSCGVVSNGFNNCYKVDILAINPCGFTPVTVNGIYVSEKPKPDFSITPASPICSGTIVSVNKTGITGETIDQSAALGDCNKGKLVWEISSGNWNIISGDTGRTFGSNSINPWISGSDQLRIKFNDPGIYRVKLRMGSIRCGIVDTVKTICVNPTPALSMTLNNIAINKISICAGETVAAVSVTTNSPSCGSFAYAWTVSSLNIANCLPSAAPSISASTSTSTNITFPAPGLYTVTLTATAPGGCRTLLTQEVEVKAKPIVTINSLPQTICEGSSITPASIATCFVDNLTTYAWAFPTGSTTSSISSTPGTIIFNTPGTPLISLQVTNSCGTTTVTPPFAVIAKPVVSAITSPTPSTGLPADAVCINGTIQLSNSTSGGIWSSSNSAIATVSATGLVTGRASGTSVISYIVTQNNCSTTATKTITVNPNPVLSVSGNTAVCVGQSTTLTASSTTANTFAWSPSTGLNSTTSAQIIASPSNTTSYTVRGIISSTGCFVDVPVNVTVNTSPSVNIAANSTTICEGSSTTLTASGAVSYAWTAQTGLTTLTGASVSVNPTTTTQYTVTGTNGPGCSNSASITINVNQRPVITVNSPSTCRNTAVTVTASGADTYTWSPATGLSNTNQAVVSANPTQTTNYTVTGRISSTTCTGTATSVVTIKQLPVVTVNSATICPGGSVTLTANGATNYSWSPSAGLTSTTGPSVSATPASTSTYQVTGTDATTTCSNTANAVVTVTAIPIISATGTNPSSCNGTNGSIFISGLTNGASYIVKYTYGGNEITSPSLIASNGGVTIQGLRSGVYSNIFVTFSGCSSQPISSVTLSDPSAPSSPTINQVSAICSGQTLSLTVSNPIIGAIYSWTGPSGYTNSGQNLTTVNIPNIQTSGTYFVTATASSCVSSSGSVSVTVNPTPSVPIVSNVSYCQGAVANPLSASFDAGNTLFWYTAQIGGTGSNVAPSPSTANATTISYYVSQRTPSGCESIRSKIDVVVSPIPVISAQKKDPTTCNGAQGEIILSGATSGTAYTVFYSKDGVPINVTLTADPSGNIRITGLSKGSYSDIYVRLNTCTSNTLPGAFVLIDPPTPPQPILSSSSPFCSGNTIQVNVTNPVANATYTWSGPNGFQFVSSTTNILNIPSSTSVMSGNYIVTMTVANCVSASSNIDIVVNQTPSSPIVVSPVVYCQGETATPLNATIVPGNTINWYTTATGGSMLPNSPKPSTTTVGSVSYYVSQTTDKGCESSRVELIVTVNTTPFIADKTLTSCSEIPINFVPLGVPTGTTYTWTLPVINPASSLTGATVQSTPQSSFSQTLKNIGTVNGSAEYVVSPKVGSCPGADFKVLVTIEPKATISSETLSAICSGSSLNYIPSSTGTNIIPSNTLYNWTISSMVPANGVTGAVAQTLPTSSISQVLTNVTNVPVTVIYSVTPISGNCTGAPFTVTVVVNPRPKIQDLNALICSGQAFNVNPINNAPGTIVPSTTLYTWTTPVSSGSNAITGGTAQPTGSASIGQTLINTTTTPQTLTYIVTPVAGSCIGPDFRVIVTVNPQPNISPKKDTICSGETFTITPADGPIGTRYTWTVKEILPVGSIIGASAQTNPQLSISQTLTSNISTDARVTYSVSPTSSSCGGSGFEIEILVNPKPYISTLRDTICNGSTFSILPQNGINGNIIPDNSTYKWTLLVSSPSGSISGGNPQSNPQSIISQTLSNLSDAPGTLTYKVTPVSGGNGNCAGPVFDVIVNVNPDAKAVFSPTDTIGCPPYLINAARVRLQQYQNRNANYIWYVDNFLQGNGINLPNYTIQKENDSITLKLITTSVYGCKSDSLSKRFITYQLPNPEFSVSNSVGCGPLQVSFVNKTPNISLFTNSWNLGNGTTSALVNPPSVTYFSNPTFDDTIYKVVLDVKSLCNVVSYTQFVRVKSKPKAIFAPSNTIGCSPFKVTFSNNSKGLANVYFWDFGDGFKDTLLTKDPVTHTYYTSIRDTFYAKLFVKNECGFDSAQYAIIVSPNTIKLDFAVNGDEKEGCVKHTVNFINVSSGASAFRWDFGDGNIKSTNKNLDTVTHTYLQPGVYNVVLFATNGCTDTVSTEQVKVFALPNPDFSYTTSNNCIGDSIYFKNRSTGSDSYLWKFGDGKNVNFVDPGHRYLQKGIYSVRLIAFKTNTPGVVCVDSIDRLVNIVDTVSVNYAYSDSVSNCVPFTVNFVNRYTNNLFTEWNFGDGTIKRGDSVSHTYTNTGNFTATLLVKLLGGCTYFSSKPIKITSPSGNVKFKSGYSCFGENLLFEAFTFATDSIIWDFGDGNVIRTANRQVFHQYINPGTYLPKATFISRFGCPYVVPVSDTIKVDRILGGFDFLKERFCGYTKVDFKDTSKFYYGRLGVEWRFGDNNKGNGQNFTHKYLSSNTYNVQSIVTGISGCKDTTSIPVSVFVNSVPTVQIGGDTISCTGNSMNLNAYIKSQDSITLTKWISSSGSILYGTTYSNTFVNTGNYEFKFISGTVYGCFDTAKIVSKVYPTPIVKAAPDVLICRGSSISISASGADLYNWYPNDALSCTDCPAPLAKPLKSTFYTVKGATNFGCFSYDTINVTVINDFRITVSRNDSICIGDSIQLLATGAKFYDWSPSTGLSSNNIQNPVAKPTKTTRYRVIGYDEYGCFRDTNYVTISVSEYPKVDLGPDQLLSTGSLFVMNPKYSSGPIKTWVWTPGKDLSCTNCEKPTVRIRNQITYTANATNYFGCSGTDSITFKVFCENSQVYIPNAFTPDSDGLNDKFMVRASGIQIIKSFRVFNRWGEIVFEKVNFQPNDPVFGWDGSIRGVIQGPDVFVYTVEVLCDNGIPYFYKGNVSLLK
jgi:PKD repeat protein